MKVTDLLISDSEFLCKEFFIDKPVTGKIDKVVGGKMVPKPGSSQRDKRNALYLEGASKGLILNRTNSKYLARVLGGRDTSEWKGKVITLYFDPTPRNPDGSNGGIRIAHGDTHSGAVPPPKPKRAAVKSDPQPVPPHDPDTGEVSDDADLSDADDFDRSA